MNTQTFAQAQDFTAITDEELMAVNGGGFLKFLVDLGVATTTPFGPSNLVSGLVGNGTAGDAVEGLFS